MPSINPIKQKMKAFIRRQISSILAGLSSKEEVWEDSIAVFDKDDVYNNLERVSCYVGGENFIKPEDIKLEKSLNDYINGDNYPLPSTQDREGYMDSRHYEYWLSGLQD